jgi:hypothetical protein
MCPYPRHPKPGTQCPPQIPHVVIGVVPFVDELAESHARRCDLMLALGSSLTVQPAASVVALVLKTGARVVLVKRGETSYEAAATLRIWAGIGEVIPPAVELAMQILAGQPGRSSATKQVVIQRPPPGRARTDSRRT